MKKLILIKSCFIAAFFISCNTTFDKREVAYTHISHDTIYVHDTITIHELGKFVIFCSNVTNWDSDGICFCQKDNQFYSIYEAGSNCIEN